MASSVARSFVLCVCAFRWAAAASEVTSQQQALAQDDGCAPGSEFCAATNLQLLQTLQGHQHAQHKRQLQEQQQQQQQQKQNESWPIIWNIDWNVQTWGRWTGPEGALVHAVYTYGAPATHDHAPFRNAQSPDGCFPGLRSYTEDLLGAFDEIHQVDAAAMNNYYPHARTSSVVLRWGEDSIYTPCNTTSDGHPDWPQRGGQVYQEWRLHQEDDYTDRLNHVTINGQDATEQEPFKTARFFVALAYKSYDTLAGTKADLRQHMPGWSLVARTVYHGAGNDEDPVMIAQDNETLDCAIVFTGTNDFGEFTTSTTQYGTGYCGFEDVHVGYRNELWTITKNLFGDLRPKLGKCNKVTCVGHSLGGALCEVFAACANSGNYSDPDYQLLAWKKTNATLMPEIEG